MLTCSLLFALLASSSAPLVQVDRFESDGSIVVLDVAGEPVDVSRTCFPSSLHSGDVLTFSGKSIVVDVARTDSLRAEVRALLDSLR